MAEGILRYKATEAGLNWLIDSAGTSGWHRGEAPDARAVRKMREYGIDIAPLRARQLIPEDLKTFDIVYVMDAENYRDVLKMAQHDRLKEKVQLIMNELEPGKNQVVPDPYYNNGFETVYQLLNRACNAIIQKYHEQK